LPLFWGPIFRGFGPPCRAPRLSFGFARHALGARGAAQRPLRGAQRGRRGASGGPAARGAAKAGPPPGAAGAARPGAGGSHAAGVAGGRDLLRLGAALPGGLQQTLRGLCGHPGGRLGGHLGPPPVRGRQQRGLGAADGG
ncbi:unnamed protein product, partial [Effrenium voratum]